MRGWLAFVTNGVARVAELRILEVHMEERGVLMEWREFDFL